MIEIGRIIVRNSSVGIAAQLATRGLSFAFSVLVVRSLGPEAYGQYAAVLAFGAVFVFLADLGLGAYGVREMARQRQDPDGRDRVARLYGNILAVRLLLWLVAASLTIGSAVALQRPAAMVAAIALSTIGLLLHSLQGVSDTVLAAHERLDVSALAKVVYQLCFVLAGAAALALGLGYYGLIGASVLGAGVLAYMCWRAASTLGVAPAWPDPKVWLRLLRASAPFALIGLALGLSYKFDTILLNLFWGDESTGYYSVAYGLVFSACAISNVANASLYPTLARATPTGTEPSWELCQRALSYLLAFALPLSVATFMLAEPLVGFLFGPGYTPAVPALQILFWVVPMMFASELLGYAAIVGGRERAAAGAILLSAGLSAGLNLLIIPQLGYVGAAVVTLVTEALLVGQYCWMLRAVIRSMSWSRVLLRPLLAALGMGCLLLPLQGAPLALSATFAAMSHVALLLGFGVVGKDELGFLRSLLGDVRSIRARELGQADR